MRTCIDIIGEIASLFSDSDFFVCNDDRSIFPDGSTDSLNCWESSDIFALRSIDNQDNECELSFCKCRVSDKVKNRNVCSDNATWYIITEPCGYWEDIRYPVYCKRGRSVNYHSKCDDMWLENPGCYYDTFSRKGNNCQH